MRIRTLALATAIAAAAPVYGQPKLVPQYDQAGCGNGYTFDNDGVVQTPYEEHGLQYNPVTISQTAIGCYHQFKRTGIAEYHDRYLSQIRWLKTHFVPVGDDMATYEFHFPWSYGLKPGWRSGLANGQAISALIRYYYDTNDKAILPLIRKIERFLFLPRDQGGVFERSPEGGIWFEEFPSDPPSFVWNGNVSAVFGLYEFAKLFPEDADARSRYEKAISSIKASLPAYDTGNWTVKDRISRPYPRADGTYPITHADQLRTLAIITGDSFFQRAWLRWRAFYINANFDLQGNMALVDGQLRLLPRLPATMPPDRIAGNIELSDVTPSYPGADVSTLFDRNDATYFGPSEYGETQLDFRLKEPIKANVLSIGLYNPTLYPRAPKIEIKPCGAESMERIEYQAAVSRSVFSYYFGEQNVCAFRISSADNAGQDRMVISELSIGDVGIQQPRLPEIGTHVTPVYKMTDTTFTLRLTPAQAPSAAAAMYRCADSLEAIEKHGWVFEMLDPVRGDSRPAPAPYCQFQFISDAQSAAAGWRISVEGASMISDGRN